MRGAPDFPAEPTARAIAAWSDRAGAAGPGATPALAIMVEALGLTPEDALARRASFIRGHSSPRGWGRVLRQSYSVRISHRRRRGHVETLFTVRRIAKLSPR